MEIPVSYARARELRKLFEAGGNLDADNLLPVFDTLDKLWYELACTMLYMQKRQCNNLRAELKVSENWPFDLPNGIEDLDMPL